MPPSVDAVLRAGPAALAALAVPIAVLASSTILERVTEEEKADQEEEAVRRAGLLGEITAILQRAEEERTARIRGRLPPCSEEGEGRENPEVGDQGASPKGDEDEDEENDDDDDGQISFEDLTRRVSELSQIKPGAPELELGVEWSARLLLRELRTATRKTLKQVDLKYADGSRLHELLDDEDTLTDIAREARFPVPSGLSADIRDACRAGWRVFRAQKRKDLAKAVRMLALAKEALPWVVANSLVSAVSTSVGTMSLHYRAEALKTLQPGGLRASFRAAMKALVMVELIAAMARVLQSQLSSYSRVLMAKSIQVRLFEALLNKDMAWWSIQKSPWDLLKKVFSLPMQVKAALEMPEMIVNRLMSVAIQIGLVRQHSSRMLYAMLALHWGQVLGMKGVRLLQEFLIRRATRGIVTPSQDKFTWVYSLNPEYVQMYQSFARGPLEVLDMRKYLHATNRRDQLIQATLSVIGPLSSMLRQAGSMAEFSSMGGLVRDGSMDLMQAETVMHYASEVGDGVERAVSDFGRAQDVLEPLAKAYDFIALTPKIDPVQGVDPGQRAKGHFVFEGVRFGYPSRKTDILKGVSFEAKAGQVVGMTGTAGCGKSTCFRLVERFYDVTAGRILLDGKDIREYKLEWLRSQIVVVAQEPKLLPLSIRDNITFGCAKQPTVEEIEKACRSANIWEAISDPQKFPNGLETKMSAVQNVSGGEKQRICIARAILADPPVLLLDEATSALDEVSQHQVQEALNKLMKGRTTLVIAHRLSTIKDSDKIIAMRDGKVVDDGPHEELLAKPDGVWKQLWLQQGSEQKQTNVPAALPALPPLQRSTTSTDGMFDVLRQCILTLAGGDAGRAAPIMRIVKELEERAALNASQLQDMDAGMGVAAEPVGKGRSSGWAKLRGSRLAIRALPREARPAPPLLERAISTPRAALLQRSTSMPTERTRVAEGA